MTESEIEIIPKGLHHLEHEVGGIDEIDVTDLTGVLAQPQPAAAHEASHITGADLLDFNAQSFHNLLTNGDFEIGDPPVKWNYVGAGGTFARSAVQNIINTYSLLMTRAAANCFAEQDIPDFARYQGRVVTKGCWIWASVADRARIQITDGVATEVSAFHTGSSTWEWLTISLNVDAAAGLLRTGCVVMNGATTAYFDGAILVEGHLCPAFSPKPTEITVETTEVFNGNSPNPSAWTDLDLSAVVGANQALVFFKVYNPNGAIQNFAFRPNGEAEFTAYGYNPFCVFSCPATGFGIACCLTDAAGIVEWIYAINAQAGVTIDVIGFIR